MTDKRAVLLAALKEGMGADWTVEVIDEYYPALFKVVQCADGRGAYVAEEFDGTPLTDAAVTDWVAATKLAVMTVIGKSQ